MAKRTFIKSLRLRTKRLASLRGTPYSIACGGAIGVFVAWTPTIGLQMLIAAFMAKLFRANIPIATALCWLSNPYTALPIYWSNYVFGHWIVGGIAIDRSWLSNAIQSREGEGFIGSLKTIYAALAQVAGPLWVGSVIIGALLAVVLYFALYARQTARARRREDRLKARLVGSPEAGHKNHDDGKDFKAADGH